MTSWRPSRLSSASASAAYGPRRSAGVGPQIVARRARATPGTFALGASYARPLVTVLAAPLVAGTLLHPAPAGAQGVQPVAIGLRAGTSVAGKEDFTQVELFAQWALPWERQWGAWRVRTRLNLSAGALSEHGRNDALVGSVGPSLAFERTVGTRLVSVQAGLSPTLLSRHQFDRKHLGGPFQFTSFVSASLGLGARQDIWIGLRLHHISNSRLYTRNGGANVGMLEIGMRL